MQFYNKNSKIAKKKKVKLGTFDCDQNLSINIYTCACPYDIRILEPPLISDKNRV